MPTLDQQTAFGHVNGTGITFTFSPNPVPGSTVLVAFWSYLTVSPSVTDNASPANSYSADVNFTPSDGVYLFRADNVALPGTGNLAVSVSWSGTHYVGGSAHSWLGLPGGAPESHADNNVTGSAGWSSLTSGSSGLSDGALYLGIYTSEGGNTVLDTATSAPFTQLVAESNGQAWMAGASSYWIGGAAPTTVTWTQASGQHAPTVNTLAAYSALGAVIGGFGGDGGSKITGGFIHT